MDHFIRWQISASNPIAKVEPLEYFTVFPGAFRKHDSIFINPALHVPDVFLHTHVIIFKHILVSIVKIKLPWHNTDCRTPCHTTSATRLPRCAIWNIASSHILGTKHILNPFVIEISGIVVVHHHNTGYLSVAGGGGALAVRTIAGNTSMHVVGLASSPYFVDVAKKWIGCFEGGRFFHIGMHHFSGNLIGF